MKDIDYMISVMQAYKEGKAIEYTTRYGGVKWIETSEPWWEWETYIYRVKEEENEDR